MALGEKLRNPKDLLRLHAPKPVFTARREADPIICPCPFAMSFHFLSDLAGNQIGFGYKHLKGLSRLLPAIEPVDPATVGYRNDQLHWYMAKPPLVGADGQFGECSRPPRLLADQLLPIALQKIAHELRLPLRLANRRRHPDFQSTIHPTPLVTAGSIRPYAHLFRCRLALNDEHSPTMHEQMVDLTDACGAIPFRLLWIFEPKP